MLANNMRYLRQEENQLSQELRNLNLDIEDHKKKIEDQKVLPYLVSNVVEIVETTREPEEGEPANSKPIKMKCPIIKTTTRQVPPADPDHFPARSRTSRC